MSGALSQHLDQHSDGLIQLATFNDLNKDSALIKDGKLTSFVLDAENACE